MTTSKWEKVPTPKQKRKLEYIHKLRKWVWRTRFWKKLKDEK